MLKRNIKHGIMFEVYTKQKHHKCNMLFLDEGESVQ